MTPPLLSDACAQGKCRACSGQAWDDERACLTRCEHDCHRDHQEHEQQTRITVFTANSVFDHHGDVIPDVVDHHLFIRERATGKLQAAYAPGQWSSLHITERA